MKKKCLTSVWWLSDRTAVWLIWWKSELFPSSDFHQATNNNCRLHNQNMAQPKKWKLLCTFYMHTKRKYCKTQILYYHRTYWLTSLIWNKVHQFLIVFKRKLIHLRTYSNSLVFNNVIKWFTAMKCMPNKMKREILLMNRDFLFFLTRKYSNSSKPHWD